MVLLTRNWKYGILGLVLGSLIITAIVLAIVLPSSGEQGAGTGKVMWKTVEILKRARKFSNF